MAAPPPPPRLPLTSGGSLHRAAYDAAMNAPAPAAAGGKQDFLEAEPYWDQSTIPVNTYKNKAPFVGKIVSTKRIVGPEAPPAAAATRLGEGRRGS